MRYGARHRSLRRNCASRDNVSLRAAGEGEEKVEGVKTLAEVKLDFELISKILDRGNDVWIKRTKTGIVILEAGFTKRGEIGT